MPSERIRESVIAGSWYPGDQQTLSRTIKGYLDNVPEPETFGRVAALISPHAGYVYSGQVAAYAYKILEKQKFDTVVIIAPSHRAYFKDVSVYDLGGYRTPLGVVPLDKDIITALKKREPRVRYVPQAHAEEHSLEIQIPFLQTTMPDFKLVPLVMGDQKFETCKWLAGAIADTIRGKSVLIVASSDLSHYHASEKARKIDKTVQDKVSAFDPEGLSDSLSTGKSEACGGGPIVTAMLAARLLGADKTQVIKYAHSGDVSGDNQRVVGYIAAAIWNSSGNSGEKKDAETKTESVSGLTESEKSFLHRIVKETIQARLEGKPLPKYEATTETLKDQFGAFVTLNKKGQLRGCIGHMTGHYPLFETISKLAISAAFEDPRFPPVSKSEFADLETEITVLSPMKKISDISEILVGRHGIYMKKGYSSGVLLPQVATEYGWDRNTFLDQTCRIAGLPLKAWKDKDTEIYIFSGEIF